MKILAIDPGTTESAWMYYDTGTKIPMAFGKEENAAVFKQLSDRVIDLLAIEMVGAYGMPVGASVFETVLWIGRYMQYWLDDHHAMNSVRLIYRKKDVCMHLCGNTKAKDPNIRQVIMDRYGSSRQVAIGTKKHQGPLFGIANDVWSAFAIAITAAETPCEQPCSTILS